MEMFFHKYQQLFSFSVLLTSLNIYRFKSASNDASYGLEEQGLFPGTNMEVCLRHRVQTYTEALRLLANEYQGQSLQTKAPEASVSAYDLWSFTSIPPTISVSHVILC
jgi:hypothetical protein